ncbi:MAG: glutathione S-transferase [Alphaproteobacteria bacterium]|nr:glutathione S-transferase [Alphaproteobacteria bacterium]
MLKVYGRANSINVQKVMWIIGELNIPHTREDVGGQFGKTKEDWYLKMNPNSVVPTIDDDGFVLWESNSIVRYLAAKHGGGLLPTDLKARADAERWMDWLLTVLGPAMRDVFWGLVRTPPEQRDAKAIEDSRTKSLAALQLLDRHLAGRDYVCGSSFTVGDIPLGVYVSRWYKLPIERPSLPNVEKLLGRFKQRAAFKTHVDGIPLT